MRPIHLEKNRGRLRVSPTVVLLPIKKGGKGVDRHVWHGEESRKNGDAGRRGIHPGQVLYRSNQSRQNEGGG